ncbi:hypothetical protein VTO42DRAFT_5893 [Malbranchea cinnamomea]
MAWPRWLQVPLSGSVSSGPSRTSNFKKREDNWVDGLRGVASFIVLTGHLFTSFCKYLHSPALEENGPSVLFQYPFLRLIVGGRGAVAIFFIVTGYVNSLNPIRHLAASNTSVALTNMSRSCFSRAGRLVFPTSIALTITWAATQLGAFRMGKRIDAPWIRDGCFYDEPFWESVKQLAKNLTVFWKTGHSHYDGVHWSVPWFLAAAFRVYTVLLVMALVSRWSRYFITGFLWVFAWITKDYLIGLNVTVGMLLSQLHIDLGPRTTNLLPLPVPSLMMILGLFLWSFPQDNPEWAPWSRNMTNLMRLIGPEDPDVISRYWVSLGTSVLMLGITFSANAKSILTLPLFNFLGRCSFAVYLLHNLLARSVLVWLLYAPAAWSTPWYDEEGNLIELKRPSPLTFCIVMPIFYALLYAIAYLWTVYVDSFCVRMVNKLRDLMFKDEEKPQATEMTTPLTGVATGPR